MNNLATKYAGKTETPDANYPTGGFKNETTPGLFDGTPFEKGWADDLNAFMQGLIKAAGITVSGTTDTVLVSQILEGLLYQVQTASYFIDSGAADAYVLAPLTNNYAPTAYKDGQSIRFIPDNTNTGASTVDVSTIGAVGIKLHGAALAAGDLTAGEVYELRYDTALGWFELVLGQATEAIKGIVELATTAEVVTGTDTVRAVTSAGVAAALATDGLGAWVARADSTIYQAPADGFVVASESDSSPITLEGFSDSSATPTTLRAADGDNSSNPYQASITFPVKKDDYWKVTGAGVTGPIFFMPLGT